LAIALCLIGGLSRDRKSSYPGLTWNSSSTGALLGFCDCGIGESFDATADGHASFGVGDFLRDGFEELGDEVFDFGERHGEGSAVVTIRMHMLKGPPGGLPVVFARTFDRFEELIFGAGLCSIELAAEFGVAVGSAKDGTTAAADALRGQGVGPADGEDADDGGASFVVKNFFHDESVYGAGDNVCCEMVVFLEGIDGFGCGIVTALSPEVVKIVVVEWLWVSVAM
jgi:hypothetical protein